MPPQWGCREPVWLKLKIRNWDTMRESEREREIERDMPEEAGRHRNYWQGKRLIPMARKYPTQGEQKVGEEPRPVKKGELACASKQSCLGGEGTS